MVLMVVSRSNDRRMCDAGPQVNPGGLPVSRVLLQATNGVNTGGGANNNYGKQCNGADLILQITL